MDSPREGTIDYDIMSILCVVLDQIGPFEFTGEQVIHANHSRLILDKIGNRDAYLIYYGDIKEAPPLTEPKNNLNGSQTEGEGT